MFPIEEHLDLIKDISEIIDKQISDIDDIGKSVKLQDELEDLKRAETLQTKKSYLTFFNDIVKFLLEKLKTEPNENFRFYIPNIRTLLEIYAQFLYLCNQDENQQMAICIANKLFTLSKATDEPEEGSSEREKKAYGEIKESYGKFYLHNKLFLEKGKINIPIDIKEFSKRKLEKLKLKFPPADKMLKKEYIINSSPETIKNFPRALEKIYGTYKSFSNYVHGNVLYQYPHGNERLWVLIKVQILSSLIVELTNKKVSNNSRELEFKNWLIELNKKRGSLIKFWEERKRHIEENNL